MRIRILLADDNISFLERMRPLLDKEPNIGVVGTAATGKEAVTLARKLLPDVVVMDISMPVLNGVDATKQIKKKKPHIKVLCLTVHSERHFVTAMLRAGAKGYVLKDDAFKDLIQAIWDVHAGKKYVSPQIAHYVDYVD